MLLKSSHSSSGAGVSIWRGRLRTHIPASQRYLQQFIPGAPGSAVFVATRTEAQLVGITQQLVGTTWAHARPFQYAGSIGPWHVPDQAREDLQKAGQAIASLGVVGLFGIDFVLSAEGRAWVIEVNPRYTASVEIVERASGVAAVAEHMAHVPSSPPPASTSSPPPPGWGRGLGGGGDSQHAATPNKPEPQAKSQHAFYGKAILFAPRDVIISAAFAEWALAQATSVHWPPLADIPQAGELISAGRPVLTVFTAASSIDKVQSRLRQTLEDVESRLTRRNQPGGAP